MTHIDSAEGKLLVGILVEGNMAKRERERDVETYVYTEGVQGPDCMANHLILFRKWFFSNLQTL